MEICVAAMNVIRSTFLFCCYGSAAATVVLAVTILVRKALAGYDRKYSFVMWKIIFTGIVYLFLPVQHIPIGGFYRVFNARCWELDADGTEIGSETYGADFDSVKASADENFEISDDGGFNISGEADLAGVGNSAWEVFAGDVGAACDAVQRFWTESAWIDCMALLWVIVVFFLTARMWVSYVGVRRKFRQAVRLRDNVFFHEACVIPFVYGVINPRIFVPVGLEGRELELVLAHEKCHVHRGDNLFLILFKCLAIVLWFNPLVWIAFALMKRDMEMSCDEKVLVDADKECKLQYSEILIRMAACAGGTCSVAFSSGGRLLRERMDNIIKMNEKKGFKPIPLLMIAAFVVLLLVNMGFAADRMSAGKFAGDTDDTQVARDAIDYQSLLLKELAVFGERLPEVNAVVLDETGNVVASYGDTERGVMPGSALRPVIAVDVLRVGDVSFDTEVDGNGIICYGAGGSSRFSNVQPEPESISFSEALVNCSHSGLISAFLQTDQELLAEMFEKQGMDIAVLKDDVEKACFAIGQSQGCKISALDLAELYDTSYVQLYTESPETAEKLRDLEGKFIVNYDTWGKDQYNDWKLAELADYSLDMTVDMSGAYGISIDSKETMKYTSFVGDANVSGGKLIFAMNIGYGVTDMVDGAELARLANKFFTKVNSEREIECKS